MRQFVIKNVKIVLETKTINLGYLLIRDGVIAEVGEQPVPETLAALADAGLLSRSAMVCNCGLPNEEVWPDLTDYDPARSAGYFATILVKEG